MNITEHLINYRFYQINIESLKESIEALRKQAGGVKGIDYSEDTRSSNTVQSAVENMVLNIVEKENELKNKQVLVRAIDRAVEELEDVDKQIIKLKYMDRSSFEVSWEQVAREVGFERTGCIRRKNKALEKIEIALSGVV